MEEYNFQRDYKCAALLKEVRASDQSLLGVGKESWFLVFLEGCSSVQPCPKNVLQIA